MPFTYHVTCSKTLRKKLVEVENKDDVRNAILEKFALDGVIVVQQPYGDDWLDCDPDDLPDGGKIQFVIDSKSMSSFSTLFCFRVWGRPYMTTRTKERGAEIFDNVNVTSTCPVGFYQQFNPYFCYYAVHEFFHGIFK